MSFQSTIMILDSHVAFVKAAEFKGAEVDIPDAVIYFFEADILAGADDGDIDPIAPPANAAIGADVSDFEAVGVFEWR